MPNELTYGQGLMAAGGARQDGDTAVASSAIQTPFVEVRQDADEGAVRMLFRAPAPDGARQEGRTIASSASFAAPFAESSQDAEQGAASAMLGAAAPAPELSGTGFTYRHNWGARHGAWTLRLNWGALTPRSRVLVSIGEGAAGGPDAGKFIGSARYTVHNVAPRAGGVDIWVNIEWGSDILLYVDYLVVNP